MTAARANVTQDACDTESMSSATVSNRAQIEAPKSLAWILVLGGIAGWVAALLLTIERIFLAGHPDATLGCDVASFISCKSVMLSWQAKLFGFPNPLIGLGAFVAPIVVGMAIFAGAKFAKWFWVTFLIGITLGFVFVLWLFESAVFDIGSLCPYCMIAWAGMIPMFWATALFGAREGFLWTPSRMVNFFVTSYDWTWAYALFTYVAIALVILVKFWPLWIKFFGL